MHPFTSLNIFTVLYFLKPILCSTCLPLKLILPFPPSPTTSKNHSHTQIMNIFLAIYLFLIPIFLLLKKGRSLKGLPPGSLGIPMIGQSLGLLRAMRANTAENWLEQRIKKYGPISKLNLFGKPTIFIYGPAANKFVFTSDSTTLSNQQTQSSRTILGDRNILELSGEDHKRVRGALVSFLKPESLKQYVGKMDEAVKKHLEMHWQGKQQVKLSSYYQMFVTWR